LIRTADREYIRSVFTHPAIWPHVSDDYATPEAWEPILTDDVAYLRPEEGGACFMVHPHSRVMWEVHSAVLPEFRAKSREYAIGVVRWVAQHTPCKCFTTLVPDGNVPALALAKAVGFKPVGTYPRSFMKGGRLLDQTILAMELSCPQQQ
jgi:hypothetical protein